MKLNKLFWLTALALGSPNLLAAEAKLLREPDLRGDTLVFSYAKDIWKVSLKGGEAVRLTSFQGQEMQPKLSPDGKWVAFTGDYEGNQDIYLLPIAGGEPKRLTFHPDVDQLVGWSPDSKSVLLRSGRANAPRGWQQLFTLSIEGGNPKPLPMNRAFDGSFSADGKQLVYRRAGLWDPGWRNYRGGQNQPLRLISLDSLEEKDLPWDNTQDLEPQWHGDYIYFLSNRSQVTNIFRVAAKGGDPEQVTHYQDADVKGFTLDNDILVYEYRGELVKKSLANTNANDKGEALAINLHADFPWVRPRFEEVEKQIESAAISPTGKRALFVARGDVFTVPVEHGDARNLTESSDSREVGAAWSNGGKQLAWFSDKSGEYRLVIADQLGKPQQEIKLAEKGFYSGLIWSPDDKQLVFSDQRQQLWLADLSKGKAQVIDSQPVVNPDWEMAPSWSPDSRYLAYSKQDDSFFRSLYLFDSRNNQSNRITQGMADVRYPVWDSAGDKLYFAASTDYGPHAAWLDMTSVAFTPTYGLYTMLLNTRTEAPMLPRSDEEEGSGTEEEAKGSDAPPAVRIDLNGIAQRVLPLGESGKIHSLSAGKPGELFYMQDLDETTELRKYSTEERKVDTLAGDVDEYHLSHDGESLLVKIGDNWQQFAGAAPMGDDAKTLNVKLTARIDPKAEWQQIFREAWRFQRDYFYVSNLHGADWDAVYKEFQPLVTHVRHGADMTYLLDNMGAETSVGHSFTNDGDLPEIADNRTGLLGADVEASDKGYRFSRIYRGENWYPADQGSAPLALYPQVKAGQYLLAVNGKPLDNKANFYQAFQGTLGKQTRLSISPDGSDKKAFEVTVVPTASEQALRRNAWVEDNRKRVDEASGGKLAYVWVPDTGENGFSYFNRYFFAQNQRQGVIIDERFNHGGYIAEYIIDVLRRERNGYFNNQMAGDHPMTSPGSGIWGPKVMLINEVSGSGGDMLPYMFRYYQVGKLVGKRTWGGLVGIWGVPSLMDGGHITAPRSGFFSIDGQWRVENEGVAPDVEVEQWTKDTAKGIDPQLEKAIAIALDELKSAAPVKLPQPADPVRVPQVK
ncbi:S41 family peptidase [Shewanella algae]|uniref:S41 family peptidase n=1 Tax=Shewanella algae TaxID=38313 RepID=UPI0016876467|nr:S41 family peptidase [Shewanella algae]QNV05806.1 protease [Shewanella algae]